MRNIKYKKITKTYDELASPNSSAKLRASIGLDGSIGEFFYLNVDNLKTYHKQARKQFNVEELNQLAETIRAYGIRQPLSVIKTEEAGIYQIISGERRLRAAKIAGLEKVPCIILSDSALAEEIAVIENIQRADLHPVELSDAYTSLLKNFNYGEKSKLAKKLGVSSSHVSEILALSKLPQEIKDSLIQKNIKTRSFLRKVVACEDINKMKIYLGIIGEPDKKQKKRKFIYTFFIKNGEVSFQGSNFKITEKQKIKLREKLLNVLEELNV